jgi:DNA-binding PadR family transcriptional regulator
MSDAFDTHLQELRRGTVVLACLQLLREPGYGYALLEQLDAHGIATDANTLYPLLRRLEKQGHLTSEWNTDEARPRKFYSTSADGLRLAEALQEEWRALTASLTSLDAAGSTARATGSTSPAARAPPPPPPRRPLHLSRRPPCLARGAVTCPPP